MLNTGNLITNELKIENRRNNTTDKRFIPSITKIRYDRNSNNLNKNVFPNNYTVDKNKIQDK